MDLPPSDQPISLPIEPSDGSLARKAVAGDRPAFDVLIGRYQRRAMAVSYRLLGNVQDSLEVTQDAFLKAYTHLNGLQEPDAFGGWLLRIVSNLSLNYRRSRKTRSQLPLDNFLGRNEAAGLDVSGGSEWAARDDNPLHAMQSQEMGQALQQALVQLPEKQRLALVLFTIEQLPQKEVAEVLQCSVEAVKWHVFQGRKKLKELMKDHL